MPSRQRMEFIDKDGNAVDEDAATIRDGFGIRVPLVLCDGLQQAVARAYSRPLVVDAIGRPCGNRPGHAFVADGVSKSYADDGVQARDAYIARTKRAWMSDARAATDDPASDAGVPADDAPREQYKKWVSAQWRGPTTWATTFDPSTVAQASAIAKVLQWSPPIKHSTTPNAERFPQDAADPRIAALADRERRLQDAWRTR